MTQPLGYFGPGPDGRRRGRSRWLLPGAVAGFAGFCLLAAVVPVHVGRQDVRAQVAGTDLALLSATVEAFEIDTGRYPTAAEGLAALVSRPAGVAAWRGPYLSFLKSDPWGLS